MWSWIQQQDQAGWTITGYTLNPDTYKNIILDHKFKPTKLAIAVKKDAMNPLHQKNWVEDIAMKWRNMYPANMYPRFTMRVTIYNDKIDNNNEVTYTEIDKDGNVSTHGGKMSPIV